MIANDEQHQTALKKLSDLIDEIEEYEKKEYPMTESDQVGP